MYIDLVTLTCTNTHTWSHHTLFPFTCQFLFHFRCYFSVSVECSALVHGTSPYMPSMLIHALYTPICPPFVIHAPLVLSPYPFVSSTMPIHAPLAGVWWVSSPYHIKSDYWHILPNLHKILFFPHYLLTKSQQNQKRSISELWTSQKILFCTFWGCFLVLKFARFQIFCCDLMFTIHEKLQRTRQSKMSQDW